MLFDPPAAQPCPRVQLGRPTIPPPEGEGVRDEFAAAWRTAYGAAHLDAVLSLVERQLMSFSP